MTTTDVKHVLQDAVTALRGTPAPAPSLGTGAWVQQPSSLNALCKAGFVAGEPWADGDGEMLVTLVQGIDRHRGPADWRAIVDVVPVDTLDMGTLRRCLRGEVDALIEGVAQSLVCVRKQMTVADSAAERERLRELRYLPWFNLFVALVAWADIEAAQS